MKSFLFTVPLLRLVIPLDSLQTSRSADAKRRRETPPIQKSAACPRILLRLIRIVTPLEAVLQNKQKASPKATLPQQAPKDFRLLEARRLGAWPKPMKTRDYRDAGTAFRQKGKPHQWLAPNSTFISRTVVSLRDQPEEVLSNKALDTVLLWFLR
jgi:hypothetical protein